MNMLQSHMEHISIDSNMFIWLVAFLCYVISSVVYLPFFLSESGVFYGCRLFFFKWDTYSDNANGRFFN